MEPRATMVRPPVAPAPAPDAPLRCSRTGRLFPAYPSPDRTAPRAPRAGAPPFRGLLTAHFLRHFQQHFHDFAFAQGRLGIEVDSAQGHIRRFGPVLRQRRIPCANAKSRSNAVTVRQTAVRRETITEYVHGLAYWLSKYWAAQNGARKGGRVRCDKSTSLQRLDFVLPQTRIRLLPV